MYIGIWVLIYKVENNIFVYTHEVSVKAPGGVRCRSFTATEWLEVLAT